jgi:hypothetical protein
LLTETAGRDAAEGAIHEAANAQNWEAAAQAMIQTLKPLSPEEAKSFGERHAEVRSQMRVADRATWGSVEYALSRRIQGLEV